MKWYFVYSAALECKSHMIPEILKDKIVNSLSERGCGKQVLREETETVIDLPGPMMVDRYLCRLSVDGMFLSIPATDLEFFYKELKSLPARKEIPGVTYYKLHGAYVCYCMTAEQKKILEDRIVNELPKAKIIANAEREEFAKRIQGINQEISKSGGAQIVSSVQVEAKRKQQEDYEDKFFKTRKKEWLN